jgi:hypothetical protein
MARRVDRTKRDDLLSLDPVPEGALRTAFVTGITFAAKPVTYEAIDGLAVVQGDIVIGTVEEVEAEAAFQRLNAARSQPLFNNVVSAPDLRWPDATVPFVIDSSLPKKDRVHEAVAHWNQATGMRLVPRTTEPDFVRIVPHPTLCSSPVGRQGGEQLIRLTSNCGRGQVIHELFHAIGAWHEHCRGDRDLFIRIDLDAVKPDKRHNFEIAGDNVDVGTYDYGSVMHYASDAFSIDGRQTIIPLQPGPPIGQRDGLSTLDIDAVEAMYPGHGHLPPPIPPKQPIDDETPKDPADDPEPVKQPKEDDPSLDAPKDQAEDKAAIDPATLAKSFGGEFGDDFMSDLGDDMGDAVSQAGGRVPFVLGTGHGLPHNGPHPTPLSGIRSPQHEALARMHQSLIAFTRMYAMGELTPMDAAIWTTLAETYARYVKDVGARQRRRR